MSLSGAVSGLPDKALASRGRSLSEEGRSWLWQDKSKLYNDLQQIFLYMERLRVTVSSISYPSILTASSRDEMALLVVAISSNKGIALLCRACKIKPKHRMPRTHVRNYEEPRREYPKAHVNRLRCAIVCSCKSNMAVRYATLDNGIQPVITPKPEHR